MKLEITKKAKEQIEANNFDKNKLFLQINMVKYDCNGPTLAMKVASQKEDNMLVFDHDGYKFIMDKESSEMFDVIRVDYIESGLSQGFSVKADSTLLGQCFVADLVD